MECPNCNTDSAVHFFQEELGCPHCDGKIDVDYYMCPKCGTTFKMVGGKVYSCIRFTKDEFAVAFFCDTVRSITTGAVPGHELDEIMDLDLEAHHREEESPSGILQKVGDSMPGFGIVAAVLGVVNTMAHIDGPPEEIGHMVGAALVGTFLGILAAYGFIQPITMNIEQHTTQGSDYYICLKQGLLGFNRGYIPSFVAEFARRSISPEVRPNFKEVEDACREAKKGGA